MDLHLDVRARAILARAPAIGRGIELDQPKLVRINHHGCITAHLFIARPTDIEALDGQGLGRGQIGELRLRRQGLQMEGSLGLLGRDLAVKVIHGHDDG